MATTKFKWKHICNGNLIGELHRQVEGNNKKDIPFYIRNGDGFKAGTTSRMKTLGNPLFGSDSIQDFSKPILICEGQKVQSVLESLGFQAVTSILGSQNAANADWSLLEKAQAITILPDFDDSGMDYAKSVCSEIRKNNPEAKLQVSYLPDLPSKGDAVDFLQSFEELEHWNGYDSLSEHPDKEIFYIKLGRAIHEHCQDIPEDWIEQSISNNLRELLKPIDSINEGIESEKLSETLKSFQESIKDLSKIDFGIAKNALINKLKEAKLPDVLKMVRTEFKPTEVAAEELEIIDPLSRPKPFDGEVNTAELLDEINSKIKKYVVCVPYVSETISSWVLYSWVFKAFHINPYLHVSSPVKRCGKSTFLTILYHLCPTTLYTGSISPAAVFRVIDAFQPTMLFDEIDTYLFKNPELVGILNAGHLRSAAHVYRCVGDDNVPTPFNVYAPKILSGIGSIKDTLEDRSIRIPMRRKTKDEVVSKMKQRKLDSEFTELRSKLERWSIDNFEELQSMEIKMPDKLNDRAADNWEPILTIASLAGNNWLEKITKACQTLSGDDDEEETLQIMLLSDIAKYLKHKQLSNGDRFKSEELRNFLISEECEDHSWQEMPKTNKEITVAGIAKLLRRFGIKPKTFRFNDDTQKKGYETKPILEACQRYLGEDNSETLIVDEEEPAF